MAKIEIQVKGHFLHCVYSGRHISTFLLIPDKYVILASGKILDETAFFH